MRIEALKVGDIVQCPADPFSGTLAFLGKIERVGTERSKNIHGTEYVWAHVRGPLHSSVWPSNRLGWSL